MTADRYTEWDAAYVLGSLPPEERHEYEAHLAGCAACSAAVAGFSGLPGLLGVLDAEAAQAIRDQPDESLSTEAVRSAEAVPLLAARLRRGRRRRRWVTGVGVAAALVLGTGLGSALPQAFAPPAQSESLHAVGRSGLTAQLEVQPVAWGTRLAWSCSYAHAAEASGGRGSYGGVEYSLVITTSAGETETVATWRSTGQDASGLTASTYVPSTEIRSIDIRVAGSRTPLAEATL